MDAIERYTFVTSNPNKVLEAKRIVGADIRHHVLEMCEPQELSCAAVASVKANEAYAKLGCPVIVEDSGLELIALGGFPGALVKHWERSGGLKSMCTALDSFGDRRAVAVCALAAIDQHGTVIIEARVDGTIARYPRGHSGFGFDQIFMPSSLDGITFGELTGSGKDACSHRASAWQQLLVKLSASGVPCV